MVTPTCHHIFTTQPNWTLHNDPLGQDAAANIALDTSLLRGVTESGAIARVWENPRCLVVTRRETRLPFFTAACEELNQLGWPVVVRDSGGTAVPHEPGVLHLSLIYPLPSGERYDLDLAYQALCEPIRIALSRLGLEAVYGNVPGAYCDGRYNLIVNGRKITGTAQRLIPLPGGRTAVLSQAMLNVATDVIVGTEMVNRFYRSAGDPRDYRSTASTSLDQELPLADDPTAQVRDMLQDALTELTNAKKNGGTK